MKLKPDQDTKTKENNSLAPKGAIWVCGACGKTEKDRDGFKGGWDASCMLHAVLCDERTLVYKDGRVTEAKAFKTK